MKKKQWFGLLISILIAQAAGAIGALATAPNISTWYSTLTKPSFTPPNWLFAPAWTTLYLLMAIAAYLIWSQRKSRARRDALMLYGVQLGLNVLWSWIFFYAQSPIKALGEIIVLWIAIFLTVKKFSAVSTPAGLLMLPYLAWVTFALILNASIVRLN